jgi:pimeloyl-ACP methyl ester carboxylesterase
MLRMTRRTLFLFAATTVLLLTVSGTGYAQSGVTTKTGTLPDGATYLIEVPKSWNRTLFLYSHGYVIPGAPNPARDVGNGDLATRFFMLSSGYALAGSSYAMTGWAIQDAIPDQIAVLDLFKQMVGEPKRTVAWGHSLGGMVTAALIQTHPKRFDAALPMCGVLSGGVATWNTALDSEFAFNTLIAGGGLQVVNITNPLDNLIRAENFLNIAQSTPQGRARLALVSALADGPGWFVPTSPEPAPTDYTTQEMNQFLWDANIDFPFVFAFRAELEARAQGNPSWNTGVNYRVQLAHSINRNEVHALYEQAGLSLDADLETLEDAVRISADPEAVHYLETNIIFNGEIHIPVLTLHTKGDGLVVVQNESAYRRVVEKAGNEEFLRRVFVSRAGHCTFTPAETIATVQRLIDRLDTGQWHDLEAHDLNDAASALGPAFNIPVPPAFIEFHPARYLRPFDASPEE